MMHHGDESLLNCLIHSAYNIFLFWTIWGCDLSFDAALLANFDKFVWLELSTIVPCSRFQLSTWLVFNHCKPLSKDSDMPTFFLSSFQWVWQSRRTKISDLESSGTCRTSYSTNVKPPERLSSTVPIPIMAQYCEFPTWTESKYRAKYCRNWDRWGVMW